MNDLLGSVVVSWAQLCQWRRRAAAAAAARSCTSLLLCLQQQATLTSTH